MRVEGDLRRLNLVVILLSPHPLTPRLPIPQSAIAPFPYTAIEVPQSAIGFDRAIALTLLNRLNQSDRVLWTGDRPIPLHRDRGPKNAIAVDWAIVLMLDTNYRPSVHRMS